MTKLRTMKETVSSADMVLGDGDLVDFSASWPRHRASELEHDGFVRESVTYTVRDTGRQGVLTTTAVAVTAALCFNVETVVGGKIVRYDTILCTDSRLHVPLGLDIEVSICSLDECSIIPNCSLNPGGCREFELNDLGLGEDTVFAYRQGGDVEVFRCLGRRWQFLFAPDSTIFA